jgi:hypothetical protein
MSEEHWGKALLSPECLAAMYETLAYASQLLDALLDNKPKADIIRKLTVAIATAKENCVLVAEFDDNDDAQMDKALCTEAGELRIRYWKSAELDDDLIVLSSGVPEKTNE